MPYVYRNPEVDVYNKALQAAEDFFVNPLDFLTILRNHGLSRTLVTPLQEPDRIIIRGPQLKTKRFFPKLDVPEGRVVVFQATHIGGEIEWNIGYTVPTEKMDENPPFFKKLVRVDRHYLELEDVLEKLR